VQNSLEDAMFRPQGLDHCTLRTPQSPETVAFFETVLQLQSGPRPPFGFAGAWLYAANGTPVLHLIAWQAGDAPLIGYLGDRPLASGSGCIDHLALRCLDLPAFERHLQQLGQAYEGRTVPALQEHQVFLRDPNGVGIECIFNADETASWARSETLPSDQT
jgi:catechol 2,3-dioxygenase-like lactoylglutathione lyase family enzyme